MKKRLVKPPKKQLSYKVQLYQAENGNAGCTSCEPGCLNCGCKGNCCG